MCQRWRCLVFGSPRRLNLQLCYFTHSRCAKKTLDVWPPALPLLVHGSISNEDNVIFGLKHRISQINIGVNIGFNKFQDPYKAMQVPFPELKGLYLSIRCRSDVPVLPDSFLGGSAPRLRYLYLGSIPFPGLPKLLLSTTQLVNLYLRDIPDSGYISPEAMATSLSMLTSLETLQLEFSSLHSHPDHKSLPRSLPSIRSVLTLAHFRFKGASKYLDEFVARIDAPQLCGLFTTFFIGKKVKAPEFGLFISRTPTLGAYDEAHLIFDGPNALVRLRQSHPEPSEHDRTIKVEIECDEPCWRFSYMVQTCISSLRLLLTMENLYIDYRDLDTLSVWEGIEWLDYLRPFTAVKNLYLSELSSPLIALALKKLIGGRTTEVLPALQNVFLEGFSPSEPVEKGIARFISARQLIDHPVALFVWDKDPVWASDSEVYDSD